MNWWPSIRIWKVEIKDAEDGGCGKNGSLC